MVILKEVKDLIVKHNNDYPNQRCEGEPRNKLLAAMWVICDTKGIRMTAIQINLQLRYFI